MIAFRYAETTNESNQETTEKTTGAGWFQIAPVSGEPLRLVVSGANTVNSRNA